MDFISDLNAEQKQAVLHTDGPLLVLAGPGSGKTRVIASRAARLIADGQAEPDEVLAVTFTNKAAEEMRERVASLVDTGGRRPWICTFHAFCARILRREGGVRVDRNFVIYDTSDQSTAMKRILRDLEVDDKLLAARQALAEIGRAKNGMTPQGDRGQEPGIGWSRRGELMPKVRKRYDEALAKANALDFDDLLLETKQLFETNDAVLSRYARRFRFVMVDEYQDTNPPQFRLVQLLTRKHRNLCVVGDPDQSIYQWRGADISIILDFQKHFDGATTIVLERNYRSTQVILNAAGALIEKNERRLSKELMQADARPRPWSGTTDVQVRVQQQPGGEQHVDGAPIRCFRGADDLEEADWVTALIRRELSEEDDRAAVLYRTNAQSRVLEQALTRASIAYRIVGGVRFYERKEIKDTLGYLRLLINPDDDVSLRRVINEPKRGIGKGVMNALETLAAEPDDAGPLFATAAVNPGAPDSLWRRVNRAVDQELLPSRAVGALRGFRDLVETLRGLVAGRPVSDVIGEILGRSGYLESLSEEMTGGAGHNDNAMELFSAAREGAMTEEAENRIDNLAELFSAARDYEIREPEPSLAGFIDGQSLLSEADEAQGSDDARVSLMTLHAAKGLEFAPLVIMVGLEEDLLPHPRSVKEGEEAIEGERRLCYVGMTRAQHFLALTSAARRRVFGEYRDSEPSRFLDEIPAELLDVVEPVFSTPLPAATYGRGSRGRGYGGHRRSPARDEHIQPDYGYAYEDEDQSVVSISKGDRVKHPKFGVGTVLSVEPLSDDMKLTVSFANIGRKTLRQRFAKLTLA